MEYDYGKLRGRIVEKFESQATFAELFPISERSLSLKLNNIVSFKQPEIQRACDLLDIPMKEIPDYFFSEIAPVKTNSEPQTDDLARMFRKLAELSPEKRQLVVIATESFMAGMEAQEKAARFARGTE